MPPKARAKKAYAKPEPIANGEILKDITGKQWRLGGSIGTGGFGDIYLASDDTTKQVDEKASYVIKIEPQENGPLFCEIAFFIRAAKSETIEEWKKENKLDHLGVPCYIGSGNHNYQEKPYRFLVIPRFGKDFHKILQEQPGKRFSIHTVLAIALQVIDIYEYLHSKDYVHADFKAANLLLDCSSNSKKKQSQQVFLLDYGMALKYVDGDSVHLKHGPNPKKAGNGTLEYLSRDAHIGAFSRRSDMEILGYNMLEWLCGSLPWNLKDAPDKILKLKQEFMSSIDLKKIYGSGVQGLDIIERFLKYIVSLQFDTKPDYSHCREMLMKGLPKSPKGSLFLEEVASVKKTGNKRRSEEVAITSPDICEGPVKRPTKVNGTVVPKAQPAKKEKASPSKKPTKTEKGNLLSLNATVSVQAPVGRITRQRAKQDTVTSTAVSNESISPLKKKR